MTSCNQNENCDVSGTAPAVASTADILDNDNVTSFVYLITLMSIIILTKLPLQLKIMRKDIGYGNKDDPKIGQKDENNKNKRTNTKIVIKVTTVKYKKVKRIMKKEP